MNHLSKYNFFIIIACLSSSASFISKIYFIPINQIPVRLIYKYGKEKVWLTLNSKWMFFCCCCFWFYLASLSLSLSFLGSQWQTVINAVIGPKQMVLDFFLSLSLSLSLSIIGDYILADRQAYTHKYSSDQTRAKFVTIWDEKS